ncbi:hypothetical protein [Klebsiella phage Kpn74]|uniref:Uncharacterized protein n=1 Tax=Klebsiella phage Kpn74 TaxID=3044026 RepID=A0AAT9V540_9CAUD|nr:hypothetical protein [Klebsiella phage Kpn74]
MICNASLVHYRETVLCCLCVDVTLTLSWKLSQRIKLKWRRWFGSVMNVIKTCSTKRPWPISFRHSSLRGSRTRRSLAKLQAS